MRETERERYGVGIARHQSPMLLWRICLCDYVMKVGNNDQRTNIKVWREMADNLSKKIILRVSGITTGRTCIQIVAP